MVTLSRIYTRTGDGGQTRLGDNQAVAKSSPRVEAYGDVDELNCVLGLVLLQPLGEDLREVLVDVQHELFDLGADLCTPEDDEPADPPESTEAPATPLRLQASQVQRLEATIDRLNGDLQPLKSFVLPGGSPAAAHLHLARAVCRRAERRAWDLAGTERVNEHALRYLNRLSDLLFVVARFCNEKGEADVLWEPGRTRR